jgi:hypothetical protein
MSKLTFLRDSISSLGSMPGMVSSQADTYMMGADRKVLNTIPEVTCTTQTQTQTQTDTDAFFISGSIRAFLP